MRHQATKGDQLKSSAKFSGCRQYRYALWRRWDEQTAPAMFIGLNPSTADERNNDPTCTRCINFARAWGYGGVIMANLFAYCATDPLTMKTAADPVGSRNNRWLLSLAREAGIVVAAWGNDGSFLERSRTVEAMLPDLYHLKLNKSGEPAHPLYLAAHLKPSPLAAARRRALF